MPAYTLAASGLLVGHMAAPVRLTGLPALLRDYAPSFADWNRFGAAKETAAATCFVPVLAMIPAAASYNVTVGYTLHRGTSASDAKIGTSGLAMTLTPTRMPSESDAQAQAAMLQSDLAAEVVAAKAAAALEPTS